VTKPPHATPVVVPQEIVNDETVTLVAIVARPDARVESGDTVAEIETSKSVIEVTAPCAGYFHTRLAPGAKVAVGGDLGIMTDSATFDWAAASPAQTAASTIANVVTEPARQLLVAHKLDGSLFAHLSLVRKSDVEAYLRGAGAPSAADVFRAASFGHGPAPAPGDGETLDVLIIGAGGHGAVIVDILHRTTGVRLLGVADANPALLGRAIVGEYKVVVRQNEVAEHFDPKRVALFVAIGDNRTRFEVADTFAGYGFGFVNAIDPTAKVALGARLGVGVAVMPQAVVGTRASVGDHAILNTKASVDHDCSIGRATHVAPGATLGGTVIVGHRSLVGIGCSVNKGIHIGDDVAIASGFTIYRDVPDAQTLTPKTGRMWW
jgi:sugar O-acyltransferase (sialic acid O-acetyltransferase NeuD family)